MSICSQCCAFCCRNFSLVTLTGADILRLKLVLQVPYQFFVEVKLISKDQTEKLEKNFALFCFKQDEVNVDDRGFFILKSEESALMPKTNKCLFLHEWMLKDKIIARCSIYNIRPYVCRAFPMYFDKNTYKGVLNPHLDSLKGFDCLSQYTVDDPNKQIEDLILKDYEKNFFKKVADKWNKNPGKIDDIYEFLEKEYSNRLEINLA